MRYKGTAILIAALIAAGALSGIAQAATNPVIDWPPLDSFAYEANFIAPHQSVAGNTLTILGKISQFQAPLAALNAGDPTREYTFIIDNLVSQGSVNIAGVLWSTNYTGGRVRIYEDLSPDRAYGTNPPNIPAPATFSDAPTTLILQGNLNGFNTKSNIANNGGNYNANIVWTAGTYLAAATLCADSNNNQGYLIGVWQRGLTGTPAGYIRSCDGKIDFVDCAVPVEPSTWGRVKSLYNN